MSSNIPNEKSLELLKEISKWEEVKKTEMAYLQRITQNAMTIIDEYKEDNMYILSLYVYDALTINSAYFANEIMRKQRYNNRSSRPTSKEGIIKRVKVDATFCEECVENFYGKLILDLQWDINH
jgi:hypothetical protein